MQNPKCRSCGVVNFADAVVCRRCGSSLSDPSVAPLASSVSMSEARGPSGTIYGTGAPAIPYYGAPPAYDSYGVAPYGAPGPAGALAGVWRNGNVIVMHRDALLPRRCLKCNGSPDRELNRNLSWHKPWIYALILTGWLIYLIVALVARKKATVTIFLCEKHHANRRAVMISAFVALGLSFPVLVVGIFKGVGVLVVGWIVLLLTAGVLGAIASSVVKPQRIDETFVWLKGAGADYLAQLPPSS